MTTLKEVFTTRIAPALAAAILSFAPGIASAQPLRVNLVSFNMGWWVNQAEFGQLVAQCSEPARNWCDPRYSTQCAATAKGLPPCNAYAEYHVLQRGKPAALVAAPSNQFWDAKRMALEETLRTVSPDVAGFQEISGEAAARAALGAASDGYSYCTSTDRDPQNPEAQRLVIAARKGLLTITGCRSDQALAVEDVASPGHFTRPALIAEIAAAGGRTFKVASVHLKSGCASPAGDEQFDFRGAYLDSTDNKNCPTLRKQVAPLEQLIDRETAGGGHFILLGDFNRKLDLELSKKAGDSREGGASPKGVPAPSVVVRLLWPEVIDFDPKDSSLNKLFLLKRQVRGSACARNEGLDHIAVSKILNDANPGASPREADLAKFAGDTFSASDHCPLTVQLSVP